LTVYLPGSHRLQGTGGYFGHNIPGTAWILAVLLYEPVGYTGMKKRETVQKDLRELPSEMDYSSQTVGTFYMTVIRYKCASFCI